MVFIFRFMVSRFSRSIGRCRGIGGFWGRGISGFWGRGISWFGCWGIGRSGSVISGRPMANLNFVMVGMMILMMGS